MDQGIYTAASGAIAMEEKLKILSNNIANANTAGYKKDNVSFEQFSKYLDASMLSPGEYRNVPIDVIAKGTYIDTTQGSFHNTGNPLDVAINGDGFFEVDTEDGAAYTRAGSFQLTREGLLITPQGHAVQGEGGDIVLGPGDVVIDGNGTVSLNGNPVDVLRIVNIPQDDLVRKGAGVFGTVEGAVPESVDAPSLSQGSVEASNVNPVKDMVGLITTQRAYESFQKIIKSFNDTYSLAMRNVGSVS